MPIPDFESVMLPLLKLTGDRREHQFSKLVEQLSDVFNLSDDERKKMLPSRTGRHFNNKVGWARFHLVKAGLLESTRRGFVKITNRGLDVLNRNPDRINVDFLEQFPEFAEFNKSVKKEAKARRITEVGPSDRQTPEESMANSYEMVRQELVEQLLTEVRNTSPSFFERLVVDLLVQMGYGGSLTDAAQVIGRSGDEGIDGLIKEDRLGLDVVYIQAKKWGNTPVGRPELQRFVGALKGQRANKGVFITTSRFSKDAEDYVSKVDSKVVLIDGQRLGELMIDFDIGVFAVAKYEIKKVDSDYFAAAD